MISKKRSTVDLPTSSTLDISANYCRTPACVIATSKLHKRLNNHIHPCDNFYDFACGTFVDETVIHDRNYAYSTLLIIKDEIIENLRQIVTPDITQDDISPFVMVKKFYKKCFNRTEIDLLGSKPLFKVIDQFGGWPVLDPNWNESNFHWQETLDNFFEYGFITNFLLAFFIGIDDRNTSKNILYVCQPLKNDDYNDMYYDFLEEGLANEKIEAYFEYMVELTSLLGANNETNRNAMKQVLDFEIAIKNISTSYVNLQNTSATYHFTTINELQQKYPYINWLKYVRTRLPKEIEIDDTEEVLYVGIDYLSKFGDLIAVTPKQTVANFLFWRIADLSVNYLSKDMRVVKQKFHQKLSGALNLDQGWKKCVTESDANIKHAVSALYTQKKIQTKDKDGAVKIVESVREAVKELVDQSLWMDKTEKAAVYKILSEVKMLIGFPDENFNDTILIDFYKDLTISDNSTYFDTILELKKFTTEKEYTFLRRKVLDTQWESLNHITDVASTLSIQNSFLTIPAAYLREPFYSASTQSYLNYGGIGVDSGYLIAYAVNNQLLSLESDFLKNATHCVVKQYENYMTDFHNITIEATDKAKKMMSENGSFKIGYHSYKRWQKRDLVGNRSERKLPGIDFTPEQLYWIASAQIYCNKDRIEEFTRLADTDKTLKRFTVLGSFQNLPEFSQDFNCSLGSYMNPAEKCQIF
ncbi:unnamed protein product [Diamesa hyperborea]